MGKDFVCSSCMIELCFVLVLLLLHFEIRNIKFGSWSGPVAWLTRSRMYLIYLIFINGIIITSIAYATEFNGVAKLQRV